MRVVSYNCSKINLITKPNVKGCFPVNSTISYCFRTLGHSILHQAEGGEGEIGEGQAEDQMPELHREWILQRSRVRHCLFVCLSVCLFVLLFVCPG